MINSDAINIALPILTALLGIVGSGGFATWDKIRERNHRTESNLVAIASEVKAICDLIKHQKYHEEAREIVESIHAENWDGSTIIMDIRCDYFSVFHSLTTDIGLFEPEIASKIVRFYAYSKSAIDSTRPDGIFVNAEASKYKSGNMISLERILSTILVLGDEIALMPKHPLPEDGL